MKAPVEWRRRFAVIFICALPPLAAMAPSPYKSAAASIQSVSSLEKAAIIPKPVSITAAQGKFALTAAAVIRVQPGTAEMMRIGGYLADRLNSPTGYKIRVRAAGRALAGGDILLTTANGDPALGEEGYVLTIGRDAVILTAYRPAGLFRGIQTIRQLPPPSIESSTAQPGPWEMPAGTIRDQPRFVWRGAMLDVARHFFGVGMIKRYIDLMAYYKMNSLHLHLSDNQGWRIMINAWPRLATRGGRTGVGGGPGGYYSQAEYAQIVAYAQSRYIAVTPEIDMPGHANAALASYAELNRRGIAPPLYTGTRVGFSSLPVGKASTYVFVDRVIGEIAALTPGPFFHMGGDEAFNVKRADYVGFVQRIQSIAALHGKRLIGWEEIARCRLSPASVAQHWHNGKLAKMAVRQGAKIIVSPASRAYMDMKYNAATPLGLDWAGYTDTRDAYTWDPAAQVKGIQEDDIMGVEAPLWSETLRTMDEIEFMAFPRLPGYAEIGWSKASDRRWDEYRIRLGAHGPRLAAMGVNYYRDAGVPWQ
jgi:hexosaminidase